ncbi:GAF domain-containing protein [Poseidonocella sp. HB161398]|uniref:pyridoxamine 5'-phosphate oxidase family protein n=1 Tax=Poseidonocella sp. HB161398 TaxID=2320855 RepID=UPI001486DB22|nr:GAF domain-containing protein [Poseidonocella sp. HB161398]
MKLANLPETCFEGVIPSSIATSGADGFPNISYLSQVLRVDETHVAISNQFFGKTAENLARDPRASLLLVDGLTGAQFECALLHHETLTDGTLFTRFRIQLAADCAAHGLADRMGLKAADLFRVLAISPVPGPELRPSLQIESGPDLPSLAAFMTALAAETDVEAISDALLDGAISLFGANAAMFLLPEPSAGTFVLIGSRGYAVCGAGAEIGVTGGLLEIAAREHQMVRLNDLSRSSRMLEAISLPDENAPPLAAPLLEGVNSQIVVPLLHHDKLVGIYFLESRNRLAFGASVAAAIEIVALQASAALVEAESSGTGEVQAPQAVGLLPDGRGPLIEFRHHTQDDSVFIDGTYVIRGVAGRLLLYMIRRRLETGQTDFTNMELRREPSLKLPEFRENLETRLLMLKRRLLERDLPVRLERSSKGRHRLHVDGSVSVSVR